MPRDRLFRRTVAPAVVALASLVMSGAAGGQPAPSQRCRNIDFEPRSAATRITGIQQPDGSYVNYAGGGIIVLCRAEGIRLVADSSEYHQAADVVYLFGNVRYTERGTAVDARRITYWQRDERILAEGDVVARLENGTRMTGPRADYLRAVPGLRPRAQLRANDRPHITMVQADTLARAAGAAPAADTTVVDANTVFMDGDSLIYASGRVVVSREDVIATSDSLALDRATERARFIGNPVITGTGERPFTLIGRVIDLFSRERKLERVLSRVDAKVTSEEMQLVADTLDLRIGENRLERAYAWGASRARAVSTAQDMTADSIEIIMPMQRLREVRAIGKALAESDPDTTKITSTERDWLRGDTIIALFDSIPVADTTSKPRIRELRAEVMASSFFQIAPDDTTSRCPKINYARGHQIRVAFDSQAVRSVTVADSATSDGLYLECASPAAAGRPTAPRTPPAPAAPRPVPPPAAIRDFR